MLNTSTEYKRAISSDVRYITYRLTLDGNQTISYNQAKNMSFNEGGRQQELSVGNTFASTLSLVLTGAKVRDYTGVMVEAEGGVRLPDGTDYYLPLGRFWVTSFSTQNDFRTLSLECMDGMYLLQQEYISKLKYPTTVKMMVNEIVTQRGLRLATTDIPNIVIRKKPTGYTYREILGHLAGCIGKNARFNRQGELEFVYYSECNFVADKRHQYLDGYKKECEKILDVGIKVTGKTETYNVEVFSGENGGARISPGKSVKAGENVEIEVNPLYGYEEAYISVKDEDGNAIQLLKSTEGYTYTQPAKDVFVNVAFKAKDSEYFLLTARENDSAYGYVNPILSEQKDFKYRSGETVRLYIGANSGYEFTELRTAPDNLEIVSEGESVYSFTMPECDVTIVADFEKHKSMHTLNVVTGAGGAGNFYNVETDKLITSAREGDFVSLVLTPDEGYIISDVFSESVFPVQTERNVYMFYMPSQDVVINVSFAEGEPSEVSEAETASYVEEKTNTDSIPIYGPLLNVRTEEDTIILTGNISSAADGDTIVVFTEGFVESVDVEYTNPLIYSSMVDSISALIPRIRYMPSMVKIRGDIALQSGDIIQAEDRNGNMLPTIVMCQTLNFGGGLNGIVYSPGQAVRKTPFTAKTTTEKIREGVDNSIEEFEERYSAESSATYASLKKNMMSDRAQIEMLTEWQGSARTSIANVELLASENKAQIEAITEWKGENTESMATIVAKVNEHSSSIESLTEFESQAWESIAEISQKATANESNISAVVTNGKADARLILQAINNQDDAQSEAYLSADKIQFEGKEFRIDASKIDFTADDFNIRANRLTLNDKPMVTAVNNTYYVDASQVSSDGLNAQNATIGGWTLGETNIPVSGSSLISRKALQSEELYTTKNGRTYTYRVYLTADGVYVAGRYDTSYETGVPYYGNKTWLDIVEG